MRITIFCFGSLIVAVALNIIAEIPQGESLITSACLVFIAMEVTK